MPGSRMEKLPSSFLIIITFIRKNLNKLRKKLIEQCAKEVINSNVRLKLEVSKSGNPEKNKANLCTGRDTFNQQTANSVFSEPAVKKTLELFGGHVIKINK